MNKWLEDCTKTFPVVFVLLGIVILGQAFWIWNDWVTYVVGISAIIGGIILGYLCGWSLNQKEEDANKKNIGHFE